MQTTLSIFLLLATTSVAIAPTDAPGSDCVAATITTERTPCNSEPTAGPHDPERETR